MRSVEEFVLHWGPCRNVYKHIIKPKQKKVAMAVEETLQEPNKNSESLCENTVFKSLKRAPV